MAVRVSGTQGSWTLPEGETRIGRGDGCGVRIHDPRLSRQHAMLVVSGRQVIVQDLGSANGVLVNGDRITAPAIVFPGDGIVCGPISLAVETDTASILSEAGTDPIADTQRGPVGDREQERQYRSTAAMDPVDLGRSSHRSTTARRSSRLNPTIAAAVSGTAPRQGSTSIRPSEMLPATTTTALSPNHPLAAVEAPVLRRTAGILPSDAPGTASQALVQDPGWEMRPSRWSRMVAGVLDPMLATGTALILGGLVAGLGTVMSLLAAAAGFIDGTLVLQAAAPADLPALIRGLLQPSAWAGIEDLAQAIRAQPSSGPLLALCASWAVGAVLAELTLLLWLVSATVTNGAPWCHRRFGLVLVQRSNGHRLGWLLALARWGLLGLTAPLALVAALLGWRGLHDLAVGCEVRRRG